LVLPELETTRSSIKKHNTAGNAVHTHNRFKAGVTINVKIKDQL